MKALLIAATNLRRLTRFRANVFFVVILPMMIILLLGATFGGRSSARIGVTDAAVGALGETLSDALDAEQGVEVRRHGGESALVAAVERGRALAGLFVPPRYDRTIRSGGDVALRY